MQEVTIIGRLGNDPEIKYFESGKVKTTFSLATSEYDFKTKESITNWHNIECWDKQAEFAGEYLKKEKKQTITVYGELKKSTWTDASGEEKSKYIVNATKVSFDGALITLAGNINKFETRFTSDNKKVHTVKLDTSEVPITCFGELELVQGGFITCFCTLSMKDKKPVATAVKVELSELVPF
jgi:single-strand DNA-binding protein